MPGTGYRARPGHRIVDGVAAGGSYLADLPTGLDLRRQPHHEVVQSGQQLVRRQVHVRERAHGGAQPAHGRGGADAVAHDVADDQGDTGAGEWDQVEPVAADPGACRRRDVPGCRLHRRLLRHAPRQKAVLQGECGLTLTGVPAGVVDRDGGSGGQLIGQKEIVLPEPFHALGATAAVEHGDTERHPAGAQRHRHHRVVALVADDRGAAPVHCHPVDEFGVLGVAEHSGARCERARRR